MRIAFIDGIPWDYDVDTPEQRPLGGTQSSVCYLSRQLAALGHDVCLVNNGTFAGLKSGVLHIPFAMAQGPASKLANVDFCIVANDCRLAARAKELYGAKTPVVLWVKADTGARSTAPLADRRVSDQYRAIAFVSEWQRQQYVLKFKLPQEKTWVLRNSIAYAFEARFSGAQSVLEAKNSPPELIYASMPFRGLAWLIDCWPEIHRRVPAARLKVVSSNSTYQAADDEDTLQLIARCRSTEGVDYHPAVAQPLLAKWMQASAILAYPTNFAETHCTTALQAMASGALVITSDHGAMAETTCGFGRLVPDLSSKESFLSRYVDTVCTALEEFEALDARLDESLVQQVAFINSRFTYRNRAHELVEWLARLS